MSEDLRLFALSESQAFGTAIASALDTALDAHHEQTFPDGEHEVRPEANVRGRDAFVVQSLYADDTWSVNDKLCRLLFMLGALKDASAERVTAVIPYSVTSGRTARRVPAGRSRPATWRGCSRPWGSTAFSRWTYTTSRCSRMPSGHAPSTC